MVTAGSGGSGMLLGFVSGPGDTQTCRGLAASCRRHDVVNEAISQHRTADGPANDRSYHRNGRCSARIKVRKRARRCKKNLCSAHRAYLRQSAPFGSVHDTGAMGNYKLVFRRRASGRSGYLYGGVLSPNYTIDHTYTVPGSFLTVRQPMVVGWGRSRCASLERQSSRTDNSHSLPRTSGHR